MTKDSRRNINDGQFSYLHVAQQAFIKIHFPNHVQGTCEIQPWSIEVLESNGLGLGSSNESGAYIQAHLLRLANFNAIGARVDEVY